MKVQRLHGESGHELWNGRTALEPSEPDGRFRLVGRGAVLIVDGEAQPPYIGKRVEVERIPDYVASQLPFQSNNNLLDRHLPPDPDQPNVRTTGAYTLHLLLEGGGEVVTTPGAFEEFVPENSQPPM